MSPKKVRIDELLVQRGYFETRDEASRACFAGEITSNDVHIKAPSQMVNPHIDLNVKGRGRFASRGGDKLQSALDAMGFSPSGMNCIDVGAASGGFTDCLLQNGASHVAAVDVGYSELVWKLRSDLRVSTYERLNIKDATCQMVGGPFDLLVADVSFISLTDLMSVFKTLVKRLGFVLILVKPQFEIDRNKVEDGGVVRKASEHINVLESIADELERNGFALQDICVSAVPGKKHKNLEFFMLAANMQNAVDAAVNARIQDASIYITEVVDKAHQTLVG